MFSSRPINCFPIFLLRITYNIQTKGSLPYHPPYHEIHFSIMPTYTNDRDSIKFSCDGVDYTCASIYHDESLAENDYGMVFLTSPYYSAEKDVFSVYVGNSNDKYSIGVILPMAFLDDDDTEVLNEMSNYYKKHANLATRKALSYLVKMNKLKSENADFRLFDYYKFPTISLFVYKKQEVGESWETLIPSLYDNGFYYLKQPFLNDNRERYVSKYMESLVYEKKERRSTTIILKLIKDYLNNKDFYDYLYQELLPFNESPFYRFVTLYQVVELLSDYAYFQDYQTATKLFIENKINKNGLRERLIDAANEKHQINVIYNNVNGPEQKVLLEKLDALFDKARIESQETNSFGTHIYTLRNKIVHEMRRLFEYKTDLEEIVEYFDKNIFNLLVENTVKQ